IPLASSSSAAKAGHSAADSRLSRKSSSSPKSASVTGASMPAATDDAPQPGVPRSRTTTRSPLWAARHADARPAIPAPTTATLKVVRFVFLSLRRHYPDQVLAVGGPQPPSQPGSRGLPSELMLEPVRYLVALANHFTVSRRSRSAINGGRTRAVSPDRGVEQRNQEADDAHNEQDRADRGDVNAGNRCRYCKPEDRTKRDKED